jgi:hypothetical protein
MADCKPAPTPMGVSIKLSKQISPSNENEIEEMRNIPYQNAVRSLMYLMMGTQLDIAYAVGAISAYNTNPGKAHWKVVK